MRWLRAARSWINLLIFEMGRHLWTPPEPPLTVVGWTSPKDPRPTAREDAAHVQAIIDELRRTRNRHGGTWHLNAEDGSPVFSDGTVYRTTLRGWAVLVAMAHGGTPGTYAWEWGDD